MAEKNKQISKEALFVNMLAKNSFMTILYFLASLLFLAPLIAIMNGTFYSLGILSAIDHFVKGKIWYPLWSSLVLSSIELSFILLTSLELGLRFGGIEVRRI